jgi:hypothetical protein
VCIYIHNYMYTVYLIAASARLFQDTRDFRHGSVFPLQSRALNFFDLSSCSVAIKLRSLDSPETGASGGTKLYPHPTRKGGKMVSKATFISVSRRAGASPINKIR